MNGVKLVSNDQVKLAYQLFLGREPESEEVIQNHLLNLNDIYDLREIFIDSPEFRTRMQDYLGVDNGSRLRHPFHFPYIPVEYETEDEKLNKMFSRIVGEWTSLGHDEPYWSTITQPQYLRTRFSNSKNEFFDSGKWIVDLMLAAMRRSNINLNKVNICMEVGCGVGRVTNFLARVFPNVIALDISPGHLNIAREYIDSQDLSNVSFVQLKELSDFSELSKVDAISSVITLQHNPPPLMAFILRKLLSILKSGGIAFIQIPTYRSGYLFEVDRYLATSPSTNLEMHYLPQHTIFKIIKESSSICLEVREDSMIGDESEMLSNTFLIQKL